jgi:hypothetical protein
MRQRPLVVTAATLLLAAGCGSGDSSHPESSARPQSQPAGTVKDIMLQAVIPSSTVLFEVALEAPATDVEWANMRKAADQLADSGTRLIGNTDSPHRTEEPWVAACRLLVEAGRAAAQAADARDADRLMAASDRAYEACEQCHAKYFPGTTR